MVVYVLFSASVAYPLGCFYFHDLFFSVFFVGGEIGSLVCVVVLNAPFPPLPLLKCFRSISLTSSARDEYCIVAFFMCLSSTSPMYFGIFIEIYSGSFILRQIVEYLRGI